MRLILAILTGLAAFTIAAAAQTAIDGTARKKTLTVMGRNVVTYDGRRTDLRAVPLVIVLHGAGGTGEQVFRTARFARIADRFGVLAAFPDAQGRWWHDGRYAAGPDDVAYLSALIGHLVETWGTDPNQVYILGHSNGGGMAMRLACERPGLIAGIAVIATKELKGYTCRRPVPVPAIFFHGSRDPIAPHAGRPPGTKGPFGREIGATWSSDDTLARWAGRNRCRGKPALRRIDRAGDRTALDVLTWTRCAAPLAAIIIHGGGHGWPGARPHLERLLGPFTREVDAGDASLRFLLDAR